MTVKGIKIDARHIATVAIIGLTTMVLGHESWIRGHEQYVKAKSEALDKEDSHLDRQIVEGVKTANEQREVDRQYQVERYNNLLNLLQQSALADREYRDRLSKDISAIQSTLTTMLMQSMRHSSADGREETHTE